MEMENEFGLGHRHFDYAVHGERSHREASRGLSKEILLNTSTRLEGKTRVLRASDVLLSIAGNGSADGRATTSDPLEISPAVENFQEALRLFPPFRDDDATTLGALGIKCPDCEAVFSSSAELKQHYLTKYCSGAAVAVYVMTRDRLITKGYRMEKRFIPLDARPIRFFCNTCDRPFALDDEMVERQPNEPCFVDCMNCGSSCNILYEPVLNDPRDDLSHRDIQKEIASANHSRSPSLMQKGSMPAKFSMTDFNPEQSLAKRARKLRDSWSFRKISQSDEEELLAISFAGLYDLERVHAPNGIYQAFPSAGIGLSDASFCSSGFIENGTEPEKMDLCEDDGHHQSDSEGGLIDSRNVDYESPRSSRRQSFFQKLFGRKVPLNLSRRSSNRGRKLLKRANTIRFSFVNKHSSKPSGDSAGSSGEGLASETQNNSTSTVQDAEYIALMRGTQKVFVHMQQVSGGAIVHDVSGRQRILQVDEVAKLFLQMKNELTSTTAWSRALTARLRGDALMKQGNAQGAVVEYHEAMKILDDTPGLDIEKQTRAGILHSMGLAYQALDIPAEAEACYLESLGLYKRVLGRDHPKNFAVLHDLGSLCEKDGYATEASALYERSFAGRLKTLGHNAPETLKSMQDLASLKVLLGDLESALLLLEKAVPALDTVFGIQNETTLNAMNKLSQLYQRLGLEKESRTICGRAIPHCRTVFGLTNQVTRDTIVRYIQSTENFDFPADIAEILASYKRSRDTDCLRVIHRLGRSYMDAGLNRDAAMLFETLVEDFLAVKGPEAAETFDALSALCVSREHLDSVDKAMLAYRQLVYMAKRAPEHHHSRKRIGYAEKRLAELNRRRETLENEKREWGLKEPKPCESCGSLTTALCSGCKIARFCNDTCREKSVHFAPGVHCIPSVSLRESKSLAVKAKCPTSARDQALSKIVLSPSNSHGFGAGPSYKLTPSISIKNVTVTAGYTVYLDPRNFTTFRMKLNAKVNTTVLFSLDSDVEYAVVSANSHSGIPAPPVPEPTRGRLSLSKPTTSSKRNTPAASPPIQPSQHVPRASIEWTTPQSQDSVSHIPIPGPHLNTKHQHKHKHQVTFAAADSTPSPVASAQEKYVLIRPGREMHKSLVDKRVSVRAGRENSEKEHFERLEMPDEELIEYAQGLLLTGYLGEAFMYVVEWVWR
ncbi:hypothetical protein BDV18DRAFT_145557 [Aspergillus unguis]